jgi:hypothetical protein
LSGVLNNVSSGVFLGWQACGTGIANSFPHARRRLLNI